MPFSVKVKARKPVYLNLKNEALTGPAIWTIASHFVKQRNVGR
jgi:hypothetical protein